MVHAPLVPAVRLIRLAAVAALLLLSASVALAQQHVNTGNHGDVAIGGYDPVAYFADGRATRGSSDVSAEWLGVTWYFANASHRDAFLAKPMSYVPQYGGFCTLAVAYHETSAKVDPEAWRIVDGKLYLF